MSARAILVLLTESLVILAVVLLVSGLSHAAAGWLLLAQTLVFAAGALAGLRFAPYGLVFRHLVRHRGRQSGACR